MLLSTFKVNRHPPRYRLKSAIRLVCRELVAGCRI